MKKPSLFAALLLPAGVVIYILFMLVCTRLFDERWPSHPVEYLPLTALVPFWLYRLLSPPN